MIIIPIRRSPERIINNITRPQISIDIMLMDNCILSIQRVRFIIIFFIFVIIADNSVIRSLGNHQHCVTAAEHQGKSYNTQ